MKRFAIILAVGCTLFTCSCNGNNDNNGNGLNSPHASSKPADSVQSAGGELHVSKGQEIFNERCETCHGLHGNALNSVAANLQTTRADSLTIVQTVKNGKGVMPMFDNVIPDSEMGQLVLYVESLRR